MKISQALVYSAVRWLLCLNVFLSGSIFAAASSSGGAPVLVGSTKPPVTLFIYYHRKPKADEIYIDNGAIAKKLYSQVRNNVPAILVNGVIAYPLLSVALSNYLVTKGVPSALAEVSDAKELCMRKNWELFCGTDNMGIKFLTEWTPYVVWFPYREGEAAGKKSTFNKKRTDERFVLFVRNDARFDIATAFNSHLLEKFELGLASATIDQVQKQTHDLLTIVKERTANMSTLAQSIQYIFNTTNKTYAWNIALAGHGSQLMQDDTLLLRRADLEGGVIVNMPPRQFGKLLDFFETIPLNVLWIITCYSGGYNGELVNRHLQFVSAITTKKQALSRDQRKQLLELEDQLRAPDGGSETARAAFMALIRQAARVVTRKFVIIVNTIFDLETTTYDPGHALRAFEEIFRTPRDENGLKAALKAIRPISFVHAGILMPGATQFQPLFSFTAEAIVKIAQGKLTTSHSIDVLVAHGGEHVFSQLLEPAIAAENWPVVYDVLTRYATADEVARFLDSSADFVALYLKALSVPLRGYLRASKMYINALRALIDHNDVALLRRVLDIKTVEVPGPDDSEVVRLLSRARMQNKSEVSALLHEKAATVADRYDNMVNLVEHNQWPQLEKLVSAGNFSLSFLDVAELERIWKKVRESGDQSAYQFISTVLSREWQSLPVAHIKSFVNWMLDGKKWHSLARCLNAVFIDLDDPDELLKKALSEDRPFYLSLAQEFAVDLLMYQAPVSMIGIDFEHVPVQIAWGPEEQSSVVEQVIKSKRWWLLEKYLRGAETGPVELATMKQLVDQRANVDERALVSFFKRNLQNEKVDSLRAMAEKATAGRELDTLIKDALIKKGAD